MAGLGVRHTAWLNENTYRRYPLVDGATADVPDGLLVDMSFPAPTTLDPSTVYLKGVYGYTDVVVIFFGKSSNLETIASATVFLATHELNKSYALVGQNLLEGSIGRINIGPLEALQEAAGTIKDFTPAEALVLPSAIRPSLQGISSFGVSGIGALTGAVTLIAGAGVSLSVNEETHTVTINSTCIAPEPFDDDCGCGTGGGEGEEERRPAIRSINGVSPDSFGEFGLVGAGGVTVSAVGGGISIDDDTTEPCCACEQLDAIYQALDAVSKEATDVRSSVNNLRAILEGYRQSLDSANPNATEG